MESENITRRAPCSEEVKSPDGYHKQHKRDSYSPNLSPYWLLAGLRVVLTLIPQTGYIHPDEYFQTVEVVAGDVFDIEVTRPWEFNGTFPIRSVLLPKLIYGIPYILLDTFTPDLTVVLGWDIRTSYVMLILPRLVSCALSFITDYCLYKICTLYGQKYRTRLLILASSYVVLVYGTRTLTNSLEMALMSLLLYQVADCMMLSDKVIYQQEFLDGKFSSTSSAVERVKLHKLRSSLPPHTLQCCFTIATTVVAGIFNRPTFLAFGLAPVFFWLQRGLSSKHAGLGAFHIRILFFTVCALPASCLFIIADSFYYGHLTWNEIGMGEIGLENFVVTPFNFVLYNSQQSNLQHHGLHPRMMHFLLNIPLLYNVLGFTGIIAVSNFLYRASQAKWHELPRVQSIMMLMTASFVVPVGILSLVPHQEARFLIPVTLPLVFLHAQEIRDMDSLPALMYHKQESIQGPKGNSSKQTTTRGSRKKGRTLMNIWIVVNLILLLFFGFLHQGGIYPLTAHLQDSLRKQTKLKIVHLVSSHLYPIPHSLLVQRNSQRNYYDPKSKTRYLITRKFYSYELGSQSMAEVIKTLKGIITMADLKKRHGGDDYVVYLAMPSSIVEEFSALVGSNFSFKTEKTFYPHFSTEALPKFRVPDKRLTKSSSCSQTLVGQPFVDHFTFGEFEQDWKDSCPVIPDKSVVEPVSYFRQITFIMKQLGLQLLEIQR